VSAGRITTGSAIGGAVGWALARYGIHVSSSDAAVIGSGLSALGVGLAHVIADQGLWPAIRRVFLGPPKERGVVPPEPPAPPVPPA